MDQKKLLKIFYMWFFCFSISILAQSNGNIKGIVKDSLTSEILIGTNVFLNGTGFGAASDANGLYRIFNIPPGDYILHASYIGYKGWI